MSDAPNEELPLDYELETFRERLPTTELGRYVTCVWIQKVHPESPPYIHRSFPNGSVELVCEVGAVPEVVGPQTGPTEEILAPGTTIVGVRFRPGAAPAVLGMPASEVVDLAVRLDELWGASAVALGEKIAASSSAQAAAAALETEISGRLAAESHVDPVAADAVRRLLPGSTGDVTSLASSLYYL